MAAKLEARIGVEMLHVTLGAGEQIIYAQHLMSLFQEAIDEMRSEEASASCYKNAFAAVIEARH
jgi:hypothetical protein